MISNQFVLGADFGTLSVRVGVVDVSNGNIQSVAEEKYRHGVMTEHLNETISLPPDFALQNPYDYLDSFQKAVRKAVADSGVNKKSIIGIGIDFTASTMLPVKKDGTPLAGLEAFRDNPHAYVKLWKHHAAQPEADRINSVGKERGEDLLNFYGGKINCEWGIPKLLEIIQHAPEVYKAMDRWIEAGDWVVWQLTGEEKRNSCAAGFKELYQQGTGYPSEDFLNAVSNGLGMAVQDKMYAPIVPVGTQAGTLTEKAAESLNLETEISVASCIIDAHAFVPAVNAIGNGIMTIIMGTSSCHLMVDKTMHKVKGISGVVKDGIVPEKYAYEAGQASVGDLFGYIVDNLTPGYYTKIARDKGISVHDLLTELSANQKVGEHGLLMLDWFNGNRSILVNSELSGAIIGLTLQTKPEDIYRAGLEATAFGTRKIIDSFETQNIPVNRVIITGGIGFKNPLIPQIYADITHKPIEIVSLAQGGILGSAIYAALAAGVYDALENATSAMAVKQRSIVNPDNIRMEQYDKLYAEYEKLHDYFGLGFNNVMSKLRSISS